MTACTCPASVTSRGMFSTRHVETRPARPAWCVGFHRPPHVVEGVRARRPDALPMCDGCDLERRARQ